MGQDSKIEWTNHTANLWWGCTHVHEGCDNCYAEVWSNRYDKFDGNKITLWGNDAPRREIAKTFADLNKYQRLAKESNETHRVFVGSMMDIFEKPMPVIDNKGVVQPHTTDDIRKKFFDLVPTFPNLMFLLLTKRPSNIGKYIPEAWKKNPPINVMFGTSVVNQKTADTLIPQLLQVPGKRFISMEPQLGKVDLSEYLWRPSNYCEECGTGGKHLEKPCDNICGFKPLSWIIQGGESGPKRRPFNTDWARFTRDQCKEARVPYFFKQVDKVIEIPEDLMIRKFPEFLDLTGEDFYNDISHIPDRN